MADLVTIFGPPAVGKAAVGLELSKVTGFRLLHNHLTAEPVAALFGWQSPRFSSLVDELRWRLLTAAVAENISGVVFTLVWGLDLPEHKHFVDRVDSLFLASGGRSCFVELTGDLETRLQREGTPVRLSLKPAKQNVAAARQQLLEFEGKYKVNTDGDFFYPDRHLVLDTQRFTAAESARKIIDRWGLPCGDAA